MWSLDAMLQFEAAARTHCNFGPFILAATDVFSRSLQSLPLSLAATKRSLRGDPTRRDGMLIACFFTSSVMSGSYYVTETIVFGRENRFTIKNFATIE